MRSISYRGLIAKNLVVVLLACLSLASVAQTSSQSQRSRPPLRNASEPRMAYEHGYRAGYEDGFDQGRRDFERNGSREFSQNADYRRADRTYEDRMGAYGEYQSGYRIGYELAYNDGYYGRPYSVSIPSNLSQVIGASASNRPSNNSSSYPSNQTGRNYPDDRNRTDDRRDERGTLGRSDDQYPNNSGNNRSTSNSGSGRNSREVLIPEGEELRIALTSPVSSKTNQEGDMFSARVVLPRDYVDATLTGHIARINRSGRATGKTEIVLAFDEITLADGRRGPLEAQVIRVFESENVKTVDEEGNVQSGSRTKDTAVRGVGGAAIGAAIGAIAGGGKGAAIGAIIGGAAGAGSVYVQGGKDMILDTGTEMVIRVNQSSNR